MSRSTEIQEGLRSLSRVFSGPTAGKYRDFFEEFLREHEFDLALHAVCDYLVEDAPVHDRHILEEVGRLHKIMEIEDDCLLRLGGTDKTTPKSSIL